MTGPLPLPAEHGGGRFPGFDVMRARRRWDASTRDAVERRLGSAGRMRFFTAAEEVTARCLLDRLMGQSASASPRVDIVGMVDARLADDETDGWNDDSLPPDGDAWRMSLAALDEEARARTGTPFSDCSEQEQCALIEGVRTFPRERWRGLPVVPLWSLWTRYAATAFYAHPWAWNEIGFPGPAYPRGYKNLGMDRLDSFEVRDRDPRDDPLRRGAHP